MKKITKVCLIIGAVCIFVGGGITITAATLGATVDDAVAYASDRYGWDIAREIREEIHDTRTYYDYDYDFDRHVEEHIDKSNMGNREMNFSREEARKLDLEIRWGQVVVVEDDTIEDVMVSYDADSSNWDNWSIYSEGNTLKLKNSGQLDSGDYSDMVVYIHVPKDYRFEKAEVSLKAKANVASNVQNEEPKFTAEVLRADELEMDTKVGSILVESGDVRNLDISSDVGAVSYQGTVTGDIDAECSVGVIGLELDGKEEEFNYDVKCKLGSVSIGSMEYAGLSATRKIDNKVNKKMELECKTGAIVVEFR